MNPQDEALEPIQADEQLALWIIGALDCTAPASMWPTMLQRIARHRLSHSTPGDAEVRKALERICNEPLPLDSGDRDLGAAMIAGRNVLGSLLATPPSQDQKENE